MTDAAGVLRIYRVKVKPGREAELKAFMAEQQSLQGTKATDGLLQWFRGVPRTGESGEYVFVTIWESWDAVRAFAGASGGPVMFRNQADLVESISAENYELV